MSDSNSDDAPIVPSDSTITTALRDAVSACFKNDNLDDLTVKRIRASVVAKLRLTNDFFKSSRKWEGKSKDVIRKEVDVCEARRAEQEASEALAGKEPSESPPKVKTARSSKSTKSAPVKPAPPKGKKSTAATKGRKVTKRESSSEVSELVEDEEVKAPSSPTSPMSENEDDSPAKKPVRSKVAEKSAPVASQRTKANGAAKKTESKAVSAIQSDSEGTEPQPPRPTKRKSSDSATTSNKRRKQTVITDDEDEVTRHSSDDEGASTIEKDNARKDSPNDDSQETTVRLPTHRPTQPDAQDSESEMSIVHDSPPPAKKKCQKVDPKPSTTKSTTKTTSTDSTLSPAEEETKRLQSHLIKCGVRKVWVKEFASAHCSTSGQKNAHLKRLLADVGMSGRFSEEKAKRIKEEREFNKDLEDTKELAAKWGGSQDGESDEEAENDPGNKDKVKKRPKRKLARGLKELEMFAGDEESD